MKNFPCLILIAAALLLAGSGCGNRTAKPAHDNAAKKVHYDSKTGRYYYAVHEKNHDGGDDWFYYWLATGNNLPADFYTTPNFSSLSRSALSSGSWVRGNPPDAYASRPPTESELNNPQEPTEIVEVEQPNTQEDLGIPDENSLDSMEGVPDSAETMSGDGAGETASDSGDGGGGDGGGDGGGGDGGGGGD